MGMRLKRWALSFILGQRGAFVRKVKLTPDLGGLVRLIILCISRPSVLIASAAIAILSNSVHAYDEALSLCLLGMGIGLSGGLVLHEIGHFIFSVHYSRAGVLALGDLFSITLIRVRAEGVADLICSIAGPLLPAFVGSVALGSALFVFPSLNQASLYIGLSIPLLANLACLPQDIGREGVLPTAKTVEPTGRR